MQTWMKLAVPSLVAAVLGACASSSPDVISRGDTQRMAQVQDGVVLSVRNVVVDGSQSGIGAGVGGVVGAIGGYARQWRTARSPGAGRIWPGWPVRLPAMR